MTHTQNYNLSQWEKTDRILMENFNSDNAAIDAALAAHAAQLAHTGSCSVEVFTYTGSVDQYASTQPSVAINFRKRPNAFIIVGSEGRMIGGGNLSKGFSNSFDTYGTTQFRTVPLSWSGGRLSFAINDSLHFETFNVLNRQYLAIAFYSEG